MAVFETLLYHMDPLKFLVQKIYVIAQSDQYYCKCLVKLNFLLKIIFCLKVGLMLA